jgi:hypothetical protein
MALFELPVSFMPPISGTSGKGERGVYRTLTDILPQEHKMSPLDVFVDKNGKLSKKATDLFFSLKKLADPTRHALFGVADHCDDKTTVPLQCADLLLGQLRQFYIRGECTDAAHILLTATIPPFTMCKLDWTRKNLEAFVEHLSEPPTTALGAKPSKK